MADDYRKKFVKIFNIVLRENFQMRLTGESIKLKRWLTDGRGISPTMIGEGELKILQDKTDIIIKLFMDDSNFRESDVMFDGLKYEIATYKYITEKIIATKESPNFIAYLGFFEIHQPEIVQITEGTPEQKQYNFLEFSRNYRQKIVDEGYISPPNSYTQMLKGMLTQRPPNTSSLTDWYILMRRTYDGDLFLEHYMPVLFQLLYCLCVLDKHKIMHNDLHPKNVLISTLNKKVKMVFRLGEKIYKIVTKYIVYIFDWDRAYIESLGENRSNTIYLCSTVQMCNEWTPNYDTYLILCNLDFTGVPSLAISNYIRTKELLNDDEDIDNINVEEYAYKAHPLYVKIDRRPELRQDLNRTGVLEQNPIRMVFTKVQLQHYLTEESYNKVNDMEFGVFVVNSTYSKMYTYNLYKCRLNFSTSQTLPTCWDLVRETTYFTRYETNEQPTYMLSPNEGGEEGGEEASSPIELSDGDYVDEEEEEKKNTLGIPEDPREREEFLERKAREDNERNPSRDEAEEQRIAELARESQRRDDEELFELFDTNFQSVSTNLEWNAQ